ncbi:MAG: ZPR1 zinc finger domain-containing protein, partial [Candidatus Thermoplasmatota archaeon]|nr:ZPR1 zinc finger domain-containing protein [Candidatus Thermoplasmatota archaeon]
MDDTIVRCPACIQGVLDIDQKEVEIPHFGNIMISTMSCKSCGYRTSDVIPLTKHLPKRYFCIVDQPDKLAIRVIRSGTSVVRIPELGARIDPGPFSEGYISNIEGILIRFRDILLHLLKDLDQDNDQIGIPDRIERTNVVIEWIGSLIEGNANIKPVTL